MKLLIADDSSSSRIALEGVVRKWGFEPIVVCDGQEAFALLQRPDAPRLVILDWMMPGLTGPELCRRVRENEKQVYTYILLLTSRAQKEDVIAGLSAGADDYVAKPFDRQELEVRLRAGRRIIELQDQLVAAREALRIQATHDSLTGLQNRGTVLDGLNAEIARAERDGTQLGLVMVDLDRFKAVNDTFGHVSGDVVLHEAAIRMRNSIRAYDLLGRYGGEEFLIVLPGCGEFETQQLAERLRANIGGQPFRLPSLELAVTASIGITVHVPGLGSEALIHFADEALYRAKRLGRNRVEFAATAPLPKAVATR